MYIHTYIHIYIHIYVHAIGRCTADSKRRAAVRGCLRLKLWACTYRQIAFKDTYSRSRYS